nr:MAG TPA: hypothetical protein [Caudoviricetes sp.]
MVNNPKNQNLLCYLLLIHSARLIVRNLLSYKLLQFSYL